MELFFTYPENINDSSADFDPFESKHILKTLRKKTGDDLFFTDGEGNLYKGTIVRTDPLVSVTYQLIKQYFPSKPMFILGVGFIKHSRMDFIIEKGTELGVSKFYFFNSHNSNYYTDNISRWEKITRQAIKQSLRNYLPEIICFKKFQDYISSVSDIKNKLIAHQSAEKNISESMSLVKPESEEPVVFSIGPEGGFTMDEISLAKENNFTSVSFGGFRLRTETAALSAAAYINLFRI